MKENGKLVTDEGSVTFTGPVSAKPTDKNGHFTDAPVQSTSDTPITSTKITQTLYAEDKSGNRTQLVTNTIKATADYKIENNRVVGSGKVDVTFTNSNTNRVLKLPAPTKFK